jgi:hypothetical protein
MYSRESIEQIPQSNIETNLIVWSYSNNI